MLYELVRDTYLSLPFVACYEGGAPDPNAPPAEPTAGAPPAPAAPAASGNISQEKMNEILAKERAKYQSSLAQAEATYKELLANDKNLSQQERATLQQNLEMVQGQLRTKEEQAALEKKQLEENYGKQLADANANAKQWEQRYHADTIDRLLLDAAVQNDAYSPNQVARLLKDSTKLVPIADPKTGKPTGKFTATVDLPMVNKETGEVTIGTFSPTDAVKHMKENPESANLFKANVVSGLGANSGANGMGAGADGKVDPSKLTHDQYRELRKKNPAALGLRQGGGRR